MEQRDFLTKQIEQMGKVLAKLLADLLQLPITDGLEESMAQSTRQLKELLDIDLDELISLNADDLTKYLRQSNFTTELMESLANYLQEIGNKQLNIKKESAFTSYRTALQLLHSADVISETFSYKREHMKSELQTFIDPHSFF